MKLRLLLADDHQIVRQGLRAVLAQEADFEIVGEAADGPSALRLVERLKPDVLVLDLMLPGLGGLEVARRVAQRRPATRIVILTMHADVAYVAEAFRAGAIGYVLKEEGATELTRAIHEGSAGRRYMSPSIPQEGLQAYEKRAADGPPNPLNALTLREREVLQMTADGLSGGEIAERLFISPRTVETHRANLMRKLGVRNQKEVVRFAMEQALAPFEKEDERAQD
jgi:two-component system, NarL family, response regulator NreC